MTGLLDFPAPFPYNTTIGNDGTKYPGHARLKRAFGRWKKAAAVQVNTSLSPAVNLFFISSGPTVRRLQREGLLDPLRACSCAKTEVVPRFSVAFLPCGRQAAFFFPAGGVRQCKRRDFGGLCYLRPPV